MPKSPERRINTRAKNKTTHPGKVVTSSQAPRRTKAEVQEDKAAKAQAKADAAAAIQQSINRTAEFEHADIANEDMVDATPRPISTPKPRPRDSPLTSFTATSDIVFDDDDPDESPFMPGSQVSVDAGAGDSAVESDVPSLPAKKKKGKSTQKATSARVDMKNLDETADRKRRVADIEGDLPADSNEEQPQEPKPKKVKVKMRDEISVATTKILENEREGNKEGNKYAKMVKSI
jgi:hypothetical protein